MATAVEKNPVRYACKLTRQKAPASADRRPAIDPCMTKLKQSVPATVAWPAPVHTAPFVPVMGHYRSDPRT